MKMLYFAYGSNMNEDELKKINVIIINAKKAFLKNYRISLTRHAKSRSGGVLDIIANHDVVEGVLYELNDTDRDKIDAKEGVKISAYEPIKVDIETQDGKVLDGVLTYQVCRKEVAPPASHEYKDSVLKSACEHGLSVEYRAKLKAVLEKIEI